MIIFRKPFETDERVMCKGCGCDIYTSSGDCKYIDDGGCGCDD